MNHSRALNLLQWHRRPELATSSYRPKLDFISPAVSTVLAAAATIDATLGEQLIIADNCQSYAHTTGLSEVLQGKHLPEGHTGSLHGKTYSRLVRLMDHAQVNACNATINDLFHQQITGNERFVNAVARVVGELHDNVASHAKGVGYSAAQIYSGPRETWLEFAVADSGCGMLENVRRVNPSVDSDAAAIDWCLARGNTTARPRTGWEQRVPDDCIISPFPRDIATFSDENHHAGEGLYILSELIGLVQGNLWIWTGQGQFLIDSNGTKTYGQTDISWQGLAIEIRIDISKAQLVGATRISEAKLESLAKRLGL